MLFIIILILSCSETNQTRSLETPLQNVKKFEYNENLSKELLSSVEAIKKSLNKLIDYNNPLKKESNIFKMKIFSKMKELSDYTESLYNKTNEELEILFKNIKRDKKTEVEKLKNMDELLDKLELIYVKDLTASIEKELYEFFILVSISYLENKGLTYDSSEIEVLYKEKIIDLKDKEIINKSILLENFKNMMKVEGIDKQDIIKLNLNNYLTMKINLFEEYRDRIINLINLFIN